MASGVNGALVRAAWLYDAEGHNFMNTMLRLAQTHEALRVVDDQHGCPTAVPVLADALLDMALRVRTCPKGCGTLHTKGTPRGVGLRRKSCAWQDGMCLWSPWERLRFLPAQRPAWSVLDGGPLCEQMGWQRCTREDALAQVWALKEAGG